MTNPRGKTNLELYNDAVEELREENEKYAAIGNKDTKTAQKKYDKIEAMPAKIEELAKVKDEEILSDTCKTYLIQAYVLAKYGRVREIQTKQMVKGIISEEESIKLFAALDKQPYLKNKDRLCNDFICGTPDLYDGEDILKANEIIDIKSCWDIFTFLAKIDEPDNKNYYWQLQGYMALTGAKIGTIAYCLVNTPESIILGEKYNLLRKMDVATEDDPDYLKEVALLEANRYFDDIPMGERMLAFSIDRNDEDIAKIYKKVVKCREFLHEFEETHLQFSKNHRKLLSKSKEVVS